MTGPFSFSSMPWDNLWEEIEELFRPLGQVFVIERGWYGYQPLNPDLKMEAQRQRTGYGNPPPRPCAVCSKPVALKPHGGKRIYCGNRCRWQAWKRRTNRGKR